MDENAKTVVLQSRDHVEISSWQPPQGSALSPGAEVGGRYRIERVLADVTPGREGVDELLRAMELAERTENVLQEGIVRYALAERIGDTDRERALSHLTVA